METVRKFRQADYCIVGIRCLFVKLRFPLWDHLLKTWLMWRSWSLLNFLSNPHQHQFAYMSSEHCCSQFLYVKQTRGSGWEADTMHRIVLMRRLHVEEQICTVGFKCGTLLHMQLLTAVKIWAAKTWTYSLRDGDLIQTTSMLTVTDTQHWADDGETLHSCTGTLSGVSVECSADVSESPT